MVDTERELTDPLGHGDGKDSRLLEDKCYEGELGGESAQSGRERGSEPRPHRRGCQDELKTPGPDNVFFLVVSRCDKFIADQALISYLSISCYYWCHWL